MALDSINPYTEKTISSFEELSSSDIDKIIYECQQSFLKWRKTKIAERVGLILGIRDILKKRSEEFSQIITQEMGKPIKQAKAEIEKCSLLCEYYAEKAHSFLKPEHVFNNGIKSFVAFEPLGVILGIMPWNFPFWQVFRFAIPVIAAGNGAILKHASNVCLSALKIEEIFLQAGFPENLFKTLLIEKDKVDQVIEHHFVRGVSLTGSVGAGRAVAKKAGEQLKKTVLELGGSDAYVILEDADLEAAAKICVKSRLLNSGQSCIAAKRFIAVNSIKKTFITLVLEEIKNAKMGDPMDENTQVGPMARRDLRDDLHKQVEKSIELGAKCLLGGKIPKGKGYFYPPTLLIEVEKNMPAYKEELFGPVAVIISAKDEEEAIAIANDSDFGLGAAVFTKDLARGQRIAQYQLQAGSCFVNDFVRSDPSLPFGGIKQSGFGRELSYFGIREFVNIKTIYIA